jgi:hypothetical protein
MFFFTAFSFQLKSQVISGNIYSNDTLKLIEYVNVGIKGKCFGTVSDIIGNYKIDLTGKQENDTIVFSHVSYFPFSCTIKEFKNNCKRNRCNISLNERINNLSEVVVRPRKTKIKWLGNEPTNAVTGNFDNDKLGCELGTVFNFNGKSGKLKKVSLKIAKCSYDSLFFRINIYYLKNGIPDTNILRQPIYYKNIGKYPKGSVIIIDMDEQNVFINQDFAVSFEWIKDLGKGGLNFPISFLHRNAVSRKTSQDKWIMTAFGTGIKAEVEIEK